MSLNPCTWPFVVKFMLSTLTCHCSDTQCHVSCMRSGVFVDEDWVDSRLGESLQESRLVLECHTTRVCKACHGQAGVAAAHFRRHHLRAPRCPTRALSVADRQVRKFHDSLQVVTVRAVRLVSAHGFWACVLRCWSMMPALPPSILGFVITAPRGTRHRYYRSLMFRRERCHGNCESDPRKPSVNY